MPLDRKRFPQLIMELYRLLAELESMFPGRPFTPDGHMVGSLAECFAEYHYGLNLLRCSYPGHDAQADTCKVEIKATQGNRYLSEVLRKSYWFFCFSETAHLKKSITVRVRQSGPWSKRNLGRVTVSIK